jgi:hypothetical protein
MPCNKLFGGIFDLLPKLTNLDGTNATETSTSFIFHGIPSCNKNRDVNSYWERWPELSDEQTQQCRIFLGIGDGADANCDSKCDAYSQSGGTRIVVTRYFGRS